MAKKKKVIKKKKGGAVSKKKINVKKTIAKFNKNSKKPYCGSKAAPAGRVRGSSNYCFKSGLRSGFKAGIDKGEAKCKRVSVAKDAALVGKTIRGLQNKMYLTKAWFRDNANTLNVGVLRKINRELGGAGDNESVRKPNIIRYVNNHNWNRIKLTKLL